MSGAQSAPSLENRSPRIKAILLYECGGIGTLKLEELLRISITNDQVSVEFTMPV